MSTDKGYIVAADQAPAVNSSFLKNVGTIEVVALRCRSSSGTGEPRRESHQQHTTLKRVDFRASTSASRRSPVQSSHKGGVNAETESDAFGGIYGLFDGTWEIPPCSDVQQAPFQLDGAGDYPWPSSTDLGSPLQRHNRGRTIKHSSGFRGRTSDGMDRISASSPEVVEAAPETTSVVEELSLMKNVVRELERFLPDHDFSDLRRDIVECETACCRVPVLQYERPAFDLDTLHLQLECLRTDQKRTRGFLIKAVDATKGYRCHPLEQILDERERQEALLKTAIFNSKFVRQVLDEQKQVLLNPTDPKMDGGTALQTRKNMPMPLSCLSSADSRPLPGVMYDIGCGATLLRQYEIANPSVKTAQVWELLYNWQNRAFANPGRPMPGQMPRGGRGGDPRDPQEWTEYIVQLNYRQNMVDEFCTSSKSTLPDFDVTTLQEHLVKLAKQSHRLSEHVTQAGNPAKRSLQQVGHAVNKHEKDDSWQGGKRGPQQQHAQDEWPNTAPTHTYWSNAASIRDDKSRKVSSYKSFSANGKDIPGQWPSSGDSTRNHWSKVPGDKHARVSEKTHEHGWGLNDNPAGHATEPWKGKGKGKEKEIAGGWGQQHPSSHISERWAQQPAQATTGGWAGDVAAPKASNSWNQRPGKATASGWGGTSVQAQNLVWGICWGGMGCKSLSTWMGRGRRQS